MLSWGTYEKRKVVLLKVFRGGFNRTLSIYPVIKQLFPVACVRY